MTLCVLKMHVCLSQKYLINQGFENFCICLCQKGAHRSTLRTVTFGRGSFLFKLCLTVLRVLHCVTSVHSEIYLYWFKIFEHHICKMQLTVLK